MTAPQHADHPSVGVGDVLITEELVRRPTRPPDHEAEARALGALAGELAANPAGVLQTLVGLVLELCRADSVGVGILEPGGENGVLRWHAIAGPFAPNLNGTMPRDASPGCTVMARDAVLLFDGAERFFPGPRGKEPRIHENLLAPWHVDGEPVGTLWAIKHAPEGRFDAEDARLLGSLARFASAAHQMTTALDAAKERGAELEGRVAERTRAVSAANDAARAGEARLAADLAGMRRLHGLHARLANGTDLRAALGEIVAVANALLGTGRGCIQLVSDDGERLEMFAYRGYDERDRFIQHFLHEGSKPACDAARRDRRRLVIEDVAAFPDLLGTADREVALAAGIRATQSTPMIGRSGELVGVLSNQFAQPHRPSDDELRLVDLLAWTAADFVARYRANARLRASEERYRLLVEQATDYAIFAADAERRIETWTPGAAAVFGWNADEAIGQSTDVTFTPEDRAAGVPAQEFAAARDEGRASDVRWHRRKDGTRVFIEGATYARRGATGEFQGVFKVGRDATERRRTEEELRKSDERFRTVVQNIFDYAIFMTDPGGIVVGWWEGAERVKGYASAEILGRHLSTFYTPEDAAAGLPERELAEAARIGRYEGEGWRVRKGGERFWANEIATAVRDGDGQVVAFTKISRDLTERRRGEEALRASEERFRGFAENSADTLWILDAESGRVEYLSPAYGSMFGDPREAVARDPGRWAELVHPEDRDRAGRNLPRVLAGETSVDEYRIVRPADGAVRWIRDTGFPIRDAAGAVCRVAGIAQDVTEERRAEAEREAFVDAAAHDLKTPLTSIRGQVQLLRRRARRGRGVEPAALESGLAAVEAAAGRMAALVDEMMDAAYLSAGRDLELRRAPMDLVALAEAAVEEARQGANGHVVRVEAAAQELVGAWDAARLARVLANLLSNATKYSPAGSEVVVRVGREEAPDGAAWAVLTVTDRGVGIPAADLPRLFERFHRGANVAGRTRGAGIGLAGARRIAEQHGGTIGVESAEGRGSTFTLRLPLAGPG